MSPQRKEQLQTAGLYALFIFVYATIAGLLGTFVALVVGTTPDDVVRGLWIGAIVGTVFGIIMAFVGRNDPGAPRPAASGEQQPGEQRPTAGSEQPGADGGPGGQPAG